MSDKNVEGGLGAVQNPGGADRLLIGQGVPAVPGPWFGRSVAPALTAAFSAGFAARGVLAGSTGPVLAGTAVPPVVGGASWSAAIGQVKAGSEPGVVQFLAEFGQDPADRFTSCFTRSEELNPDARGVDVGPDRQRTEIFRADLERHDVLAMGRPHQCEERFGQLRRQGCREMGSLLRPGLGSGLRRGLGHRLGPGLGSGLRRG